MSSPYPIENRGSGSTGQLLGEWPGCSVGGQEGPLATKWLPSQPALCGEIVALAIRSWRRGLGTQVAVGPLTPLSVATAWELLCEKRREVPGGHAWGRRWGIRVVPRGWERDNRSCCHPFRPPHFAVKVSSSGPLTSCPVPPRLGPAWPGGVRVAPSHVHVLCSPCVTESGSMDPLGLTLPPLSASETPILSRFSSCFSGCSFSGAFAGLLPDVQMPAFLRGRRSALCSLPRPVSRTP